MPEAFDPYYTWLGISPRDRPFDYYRFLGLQRFESDSVVIESAADQRMAHLRAFQTGPRGELAARILNELAAARVVLLNPQKKAAYDNRLRQAQAPSKSSGPPVAAAGAPSRILASAPMPLEPRPNRRPWLLGAAAAGSIAMAALLIVTIVYFASGSGVDNKETAAIPQAAASSATPAPGATGGPADSPTAGTDSQTAVASAAPAGADSSPVSTINQPAPAGGSSPVDVLALVDIGKDAQQGKTVRLGDGLDIRWGHPATIRFPCKLPAEYQIDAIVIRKSGNGMLSFALAIGGHEFQFHFDAKSHNRFITGVGLLEGKRCSVSLYTYHREVLHKDEPQALSLIVRSHSIQVSAGGATIFKWQGDPKNVSHVSADPFEFGVVTWDGAFEIQRVAITPLGPEVAQPSIAAIVPEKESAPKAIPDLPPAPKIQGPNPTALLPPPRAAPLDPSNSGLAAATLAIFKEDCYRCHGRDGSNEGGLNFILQSDKLIANRYVVPSDASGSLLFKRLTEGTMPPQDEKPRPTTDQIAAMRRWIEAGAPQISPPPANRIFVSNADVVRTIHDDVMRLDSISRPFARYFTLTHLYNVGQSDDELETYRLGLSKLINSLSWGDRIVVPQPIDAAKTILRVDLRDFKWNDKTWDEILAQNPYSFIPGTPQARELARETRTELPFVRGDWFVSAASEPPLYHQVLGIPESLAEMENLLRISSADDIQ